MATRPALETMGLSAGKKARLHRLLFQHGIGNGTAMFLPYDQGLEHGPRDFASNPRAGDPAYIIDLAIAGGFNGVVLQVGTAERFYWEFAGQVPLVLKLNGRTEIVPNESPRSPLNATVSDAVRLGADAVGYTLYAGSRQQEADFEAFSKVRQDADAAGMPIIVWAYPRGSVVDEAGGKESFYQIDYAARTAAELGADIVKVNFPKPDLQTNVKPPYDRKFSELEALQQVVASAGRSLVILSGGEKVSDEVVLSRTDDAMRAGACGVIFGRNIWQRERNDALALASDLRTILEKY